MVLTGVALIVVSLLANPLCVVGGVWLTPYVLAVGLVGVVLTVIGYVRQN